MLVIKQFGPVTYAMGTLQEILAGTGIAAKVRALPNDVAGCTLEMGADGLWTGNLGTLTRAQADALVAAGVMGNVKAGAPAQVDGVQYTWRGEGAGWVDKRLSARTWLANRRPVGDLETVSIASNVATLTQSGAPTLPFLQDKVSSYLSNTSSLGRGRRFGLSSLNSYYTGRYSIKHYGTSIEFQFDSETRGMGYYSRVTFLIHEEGRFKMVQRAAIYITPDASTDNVIKLVFPNAAVRQIEVMGMVSLRQVYTNNNESVSYGDKIGPRILFATDSFGGATAQTTLANGHYAYPTMISHMLGFNDCVVDFEGGSGWSSTGDYREILTRVATAITPAKADIIVFALGRNDNSSDPTFVYQKCCLGLDAAIAQNPQAEVWVFGMMWDDGPEYWTSNIIAVHKAIKQAATERGLPYISTMEMDPTFTAADPNSPNQSGLATKGFGMTAGVGNQFDCTGLIPVGSVIMLGSGSTAEYATVASQSGERHILTKVVKYNHAVGDTIKIMPQSLVTGNGFGGTGTGTAALFFGTDGVHPYDAGNLAYAAFYSYGMVNVARRLIGG